MPQAEPPAIHQDIEAFFAALPGTGRLLGIDAGTKTLGLATCDETRLIASPLETIRRTKFRKDGERLEEVIAENRIVAIVMGLPTNLDGSEGPRAQATRAMARNILQLSSLPVLLWNERLSTAEAERLLISADASRKRRSEVIDKLAATLILQGAIDRLRHLRTEVAGLR